MKTLLLASLLSLSLSAQDVPDATLLPITLDYILPGDTITKGPVDCKGCGAKDPTESYPWDPTAPQGQPLPSTGGTYTWISPFEPVAWELANLLDTAKLELRSIEITKESGKCLPVDQTACYIEKHCKFEVTMNFLLEADPMWAGLLTDDVLTFSSPQGIPVLVAGTNIRTLGGKLYVDYEYTFTEDPVECGATVELDFNIDSELLGGLAPHLFTFWLNVPPSFPTSYGVTIGVECVECPNQNN